MAHDDFDYVKDVLTKPDGYKGYQPTPHPMPDLIAAMDCADRVDDARVLVSIALKQVKGTYRTGSQTHRLVVMLQSIQGILEGECKDLQRCLEKCENQLREEHGN